MYLFRSNIRRDSDRKIYKTRPRDCDRGKSDGAALVSWLVTVWHRPLKVAGGYPCTDWAGNPEPAEA